MKNTKLLLVIAILTFTSFALAQDFLKNEVKGDDTFNLEEHLNKYSKETLQTIAVYCNNYDQKKRGTPSIWLLPFAKYSNMFTKEDLVKYIVKMTGQYPDLKPKGVLETNAGISQVFANQTYKDYLLTKDKQTLTDMALKGEAYARKKQGKEHVMGGIHDYIRFMNEEEIANVIMDFIKAYPELGENRLLEILTEGKMTSPDAYIKQIQGMSRLDLIHYAIACDEYDHVKNPRFGGLHDYAYSLTKDQLLDGIKKLLIQYPELCITGRLQTLVEEFRTNHPNHFGGLHDYLNDFNKNELIKLALAGEAFDRKAKNIFVLGGLHDYVNTLSEVQLSNIIKDYINLYPELAVRGKLEELAGIQTGGFIGYIKSLLVPELKRICLALEKKTKKEGQKGGIHDYIDSLSSDELVDYIRTTTDNYTVTDLRSKEAIDKLLKE